MGCVDSDEAGGNDLALQDFDNDNQIVYLGKADQTVDKYDRPEVDPGVDMFEVAEESGGEEFMATKPWMGALVAPTNKPDFKAGPPGRTLEVSFVNGYRTEDARSNLYFLNPNEIIYPAACLGIKQDLKTRKQVFYGGGPSKSNDKHTDDIISLAISPDRKLVATGSLGARPLVMIWDPQSMSTVASFKLDRNTRCVAVMCFSRDGKTLFLGDKANEHNVYRYDIQGNKLDTTKTGSDNLNDCAASNDGFATVSKDGFLFFGASDFKKKRGLSNGNDVGPLACVASSGSTFYAGDIKGGMFVFEGNNCTKGHAAHEKALMALAAFEDCIVSSGADNKVKVWSKSLECTREITIESYCKAIDKLGDSLILGSRLGEIIHVDATNQPKQIMKTHWTGETWGLGICPKTGLLITSGDDNLILAFDPKTKTVVSSATVSDAPGRRKKIGGASTLSLLPPNQQARAVAISTKSGHVAFGTNTGGLSVRASSKDLASVVFENLALAKEWIEVMKYCPKGEQLAVGSHDNNIYILG
jgi:WD40 repeat protein